MSKTNYAGALSVDPTIRAGWHPSVADFVRPQVASGVPAPIGDGSSHPLSDYYASAGAAQAAYPSSEVGYDVQLTDELFTVSMLAAINALDVRGGGRLDIPPGDYISGGASIPIRGNIHVTMGAGTITGPADRSLFQTWDTVAGVAVGYSNITIEGAGKGITTLRTPNGATPTTISGTCNTSGTAVVGVSGTSFASIPHDANVVINGVSTKLIGNATDATHMTVATNLGTQAGVVWYCGLRCNAIELHDPSDQGSGPAPNLPISSRLRFEHFTLDGNKDNVSIPPGAGADDLVHNGILSNGANWVRLDLESINWWYAGVSCGLYGFQWTGAINTRNNGYSTVIGYGGLLIQGTSSDVDVLHISVLDVIPLWIINNVTRVRIRGTYRSSISHSIVIDDNSDGVTGADIDVQIIASGGQSLSLGGGTGPVTRNVIKAEIDNSADYGVWVGENVVANRIELIVRRSAFTGVYFNGSGNHLHLQAIENTGNCLRLTALAQNNICYVEAQDDRGSPAQTGVLSDSGSSGNQVQVRMISPPATNPWVDNSTGNAYAFLPALTGPQYASVRPTTDDGMVVLAGGSGAPSGRVILSGSTWVGGVNAVSDNGGASIAIRDDPAAKFRIVKTSDGVGYTPIFEMDSSGAFTPQWPALAGNAGLILHVNAGETAVEWSRVDVTDAGQIKDAAAPLTGGNLLKWDGTKLVSATSADVLAILPAISGNAGLTLHVNAAETAADWERVDISDPGQIKSVLHALTPGDLVAWNGTYFVTASGATPTGSAGGDLGSTYPNPTVVATHLAAPLTKDQGGTGTDLSATGGTSKFLKQATAGGAITVVRPSSADLSDGPFVPTSSVGAAGGVAGLDGSGRVSVSEGGTGASSLTNHGVLIGQGTSAVQVTAAGTNDYPLISHGASSDPGFGVLNPAGGGTGRTSLTAHALFAGDGTNAPIDVGPGSLGKILKGQGASANPEFYDLSDDTLQSYTTRSTAITTTNIQRFGAIPPAGLYVVNLYLCCSVAGTGSATIRIDWNDGISAKTSQTTSNLNSTGSAGYTFASWTIRADGTNNVTFAVSLFGTGGSERYDAYIALTRIGG